MVGEPPAPPPAPPPVEPKAEPNPSTTTIASLNDDLLLEILLRLPSLPALVRAVLTCRSWLCAVRSSPGFRRRFRALHPDPLLGLFIDCDGPAIPGTPSFAPAASLPDDDPDLAVSLRGGDFTLESLMQGDYASPGWHTVDCRGGYLLLLNPFDRRFAVLNPLIWDVDFLPLLPGDIELEEHGASAFTGFHLLYSDDDPCSFRVVCVCRDGLRLRAVVFSSETRDWIIHPWVEFAGDGNMRPMSNTGVLVDGSIYWPYDGEGGMMKLNTLTMELSSAELPWKSIVQGCSFMAGDTKDGGLCILYAIDFFILVWIPRVDRNGIERWVPQKIFSLTPYLSWITKGSQHNYKGMRVVGVRSGYVYLATVDAIPDDHAPYWFFSLCLETMKFERLFQERFEGRFYPYIMAWPPSLVRDVGSFGHEVEGSQ